MQQRKIKTLQTDLPFLSQCGVCVVQPNEQFAGWIVLVPSYPILMVDGTFFLAAAAGASAAASTTVAVAFLIESVIETVYMGLFVCRASPFSLSTSLSYPGWPAKKSPCGDRIVCVRMYCLVCVFGIFCGGTWQKQRQSTTGSPSSRLWSIYGYTCPVSVCFRGGRADGLEKVLGGLARSATLLLLPVPIISA